MPLRAFESRWTATICAFVRCADAGGGGSKQDRVDNAQDMTNYYYDLVTDFYEYGW